MICLKITYLKISHEGEGREIGLSLEKEFLSPGLCRGRTFANFHNEGTSANSFIIDYLRIASTPQ